MARKPAAPPSESTGAYIVDITKQYAPVGMLVAVAIAAWSIASSFSERNTKVDARMEVFSTGLTSIAENLKVQVGQININIKELTDEFKLSGRDKVTLIQHRLWCAEVKGLNKGFICPTMIPSQ